MSEREPMTIDELIEEFEFLGDWDAQCDYLIDLGSRLTDWIHTTLSP